MTKGQNLKLKRRTMAKERHESRRQRHQQRRTRESKEGRQPSIYQQLRGLREPQSTAGEQLWGRRGLGRQPPPPCTLGLVQARHRRAWRVGSPKPPESFRRRYQTRSAPRRRERPYWSASSAEESPRAAAGQPARPALSQTGRSSPLSHRPREKSTESPTLLRQSCDTHGKRLSPGPGKHPPQTTFPAPSRGAKKTKAMHSIREYESH